MNTGNGRRGGRRTAYALVRLEIDSVVVADSTGAESVGVGTLLGASPTRSARWSRAGCSTSSRPTARSSTGWPTGCRSPLRHGRVRPLGLDRYGVQLRVENDDGDHDVRLPFAKPVDDVTGLSQAIRVLMGCPFLNGLRARRI